MSLLNFFKKNNAEKTEDINQTANNTAVENKEDEGEIAAAISAVLSLMDDEEETVAAITAAIACMLGRSTSEFVVRNIKRSPELDSIWAQAGRMKLMR